MKKGQLTIEYLLILVVLVILFTNVSTDLMNFTSKNTLQLQTKEIERAHNQTLLNTIQTLSLQAPGAKRSLTLTAPSDCAYIVEPDRVKLDCGRDTPSYNYSREVIGKVPPEIQVAYTTDKIPQGETKKVVLVKTY